MLSGVFASIIKHQQPNNGAQRQSIYCFSQRLICIWNHYQVGRVTPCLEKKKFNNYELRIQHGISVNHYKTHEGKAHQASGFKCKNTYTNTHTLVGWQTR